MDNGYTGCFWRNTVLLFVFLVSVFEPASWASQKHFAFLVGHTREKNALSEFSLRSRFGVGISIAEAERLLAPFYTGIRIDIPQDSQMSLLKSQLNSLTGAGHEVDLYFLGQSSQDIVAVISSLSEQTCKGIRLISAAVNTEESQRSIQQLSCGGSKLAYMNDVPFFFPQFLKSINENRSLSESVARARWYSDALIKRDHKVRSFLDSDLVKKTNGNKVATLSGPDIDFRLGRMDSVYWENSEGFDFDEELSKSVELSEEKLFYTQNKSSDFLIRMLSDTIGDGLKVDSNRVSSPFFLAEELSRYFWSTYPYIFKDKNAHQIKIERKDLRSLMTNLNPVLDEYIQLLVEHIESIQIIRADEHSQNKTVVKIVLDTESITIPVKDKKLVKNGQIYQLELLKNISFKLSLTNEQFAVEDFQGLSVFAKIPFLPDEVMLRNLKLNLNTEILDVEVDAISGLFSVIGHIDLRTKSFDGVDWLETILANIPVFFAVLIFLI